MTPSLMPGGPDAQHMLDPSSKSVVSVIVMRQDKTTFTQAAGDLSGAPC